MEKISRQRLEFATILFLAEMRKQYARIHPNQDGPIKGLSSYPEAERSALMAAVERAVAAAGSGGESDYLAWIAQRDQKSSS
jgi:hypothetical protein